MSHNQIYLEQIIAMSDALTAQISELDDEMLRTRPGHALNSAGFIYFHLLRVWDLDLNVLIRGRSAKDDAWHLGGYGEELGYNLDGKGMMGMGIGTGYNDQEVDEIPYRSATLRRYHQQLMDETRSYLDHADDAELFREITVRKQPSSPSLRLQHVVAHSWNHIGELRMTKGMLGFADPTTPPRQPSA
jgi:hypothetical protein